MKEARCVPVVAKDSRATSGENRSALLQNKVKACVQIVYLHLRPRARTLADRRKKDGTPRRSDKDSS